MRVSKRVNQGGSETLMNRKSNQSHRIGSMPGIKPSQPNLDT